MERRLAELAIKKMLRADYGHYSRAEEHKLILDFLRGVVPGGVVPDGVNSLSGREYPSAETFGQVLMPPGRSIDHFSLAMQPLRSIKNNMICAVAVMCRYAADLGADDERCYALSDYYINEIETQVNIHNWEQTILEIARHYSELVKNGEQERYTLPVRRAIRYIRQHLYEACSLCQVAAAVKLHPNYLSTLFKAETGVPVSDYIRQIKIREAVNLLREGNYSVSEVSEMLGYHSLSYFSKVFHRVCGCGPRAFRSGSGSAASDQYLSLSGM